MIKAASKRSDGRHTIVLGLSRRNTELLLQGKPICIDTEQVPPNGLSIPGGPIILVCAGETEEHIELELQAAQQQGGPS